MKNHLILVLTLFLVLSCVTLEKKRKNKIIFSYLNYYKVASIADSLFVLKQYKKADDYYSCLFTKAKPINTFRLREYNRFIMNKYLLNKKIEKKELKSLISEYGVTENEIKADHFLNIIYKNHRFTKKDYDYLREKYVKSLNLDLRNKIEKRIEEDQYYRTYYSEPDLDTKWKKCDSINEKLLFDLFEKDIYPDKSIIGTNIFEGTVVDLELLLLHTKDSIRNNYFLPRIKEFVVKGKCSPYLYAMMIDQYHLYNDIPQVYGTYNLPNIPKEKYPYFNNNRNDLNIGLPSIEFDVFWYYYLDNERNRCI